MVNAKVFAINSSCSRKTNVECSADRFDWVSCENAITVLATFCQIKESMLVSVFEATPLTNVKVIESDLAKQSPHYTKQAWWPK